jgi:quercetin dioxygenase-like cupin family protein
LATPPRRHRAASAIDRLLFGVCVSYTVGETTYEASAGAFVMVPPGVPHTFANPSDQPTVLFNAFTPDLYVQYFRNLP